MRLMFRKGVRRTPRRWRRFGDTERLKKINRAPSLFCEDGLQVRELHEPKPEILKYPRREKFERIGVTAIDLRGPSSRSRRR